MKCFEGIRRGALSGVLLISTAQFAVAGSFAGRGGSVESDSSEQARIQALETRLHLLEKEIKELRSAVGSNGRTSRNKDRVAVWHGPDVKGKGRTAPQNGNVYESGAEKDYTLDGDNKFAQDTKRTDSQAPAAALDEKKRDQKLGQPDSGKPALSDQDDQDALRNLTVIRDSAVTTKAGHLTWEGKFSYIRQSSSLQFSRALLLTNSLRYGILSNLEASVSVPLYQAHRSTQTSPVTHFTSDVSALGDVSAQLTGTVFGETINTPAVYLYGGFTAPTGPDPYWLSTTGGVPVAQPINPLYFTQSSGHWSGTVGATVVKTFEPMIYFGGVSYTHYLPRDFGGSTMQPGDRITYSIGMGLAVSERTTLGAVVQGIYQNRLTMDGRLVDQSTEAEAILLTLSISQKLAMGFAIEPSVTMGLTGDAPAAQVSVGLRKTF